MVGTLVSTLGYPNSVVLLDVVPHLTFAMGVVPSGSSSVVVLCRHAMIVCITFQLNPTTFPSHLLQKPLKTTPIANVRCGRCWP